MATLVWMQSLSLGLRGLGNWAQQVSQGVNCIAEKKRKRGDAVVDRGRAKLRESRIGYIFENEIVLSNQGSGHARPGSEHCHDILRAGPN